jgi:hypothetical protein
MRRTCDRPHRTSLRGATNILPAAEAYGALHPETKNGAIGNGREKVRQVGEATPERFTADTAKKTGQSERAVQGDAARGETSPLGA